MYTSRADLSQPFCSYCGFPPLGSSSPDGSLGAASRYGAVDDLIRKAGWLHQLGASGRRRGGGEPRRRGGSRPRDQSRPEWKRTVT